MLLLFPRCNNGVTILPGSLLVSIRYPLVKAILPVPVVFPVPRA